MHGKASCREGGRVRVRGQERKKKQRSNGIMKGLSVNLLEYLAHEVDAVVYLIYFA